MITPLEIIVKDGLTTTTGALKMMETDPHGFTLSIVAISVVFSCLLILFCVYSLMGAIFTGKFRRKDKAASPSAGLGAEGVGSADSSEIAAAIGLALHLYLGGNHDPESGYITIGNQYQSAWADKGRGFRKLPRK